MIGKLLGQAIGDAPEHVAGLRKLAVAFAIGGRLDGQTALPPEDILAEIETVKKELEKAGKLKRRKANFEVLPEHFPETFSDVNRFIPLAQIASIEKGKTGIKQAVAGEFPLVVTAASRESCDHYDFDAEAAIIPLVSSTGHGHASINRLHYQEGKFALGTILAAVLPHDPSTISARFLFEYLSAFKEELLVSRMTGTANVTLTIGRIGDVPVPLLSSQTQSKVDELMALCDRLEEARKTREETRDRFTAATLARLTAPETATASETDDTTAPSSAAPNQTGPKNAATGSPSGKASGQTSDFRTHARVAIETLPALTSRPDQIKSLRQTILNLAVRGKLVEQDPADEPASDLVERINEKRAKLVKTREAKKLKRGKGEEWPFTLPESWSWCTLGALSRLITKGSSPKWQGVGYVAKHEGLLFITSENVGNFSLRKLDDLKYVESRFNEVEPRSMLRRGDILINLVGASIGRTAIYDLDDEANINQAVALVRMVDPNDCPSLDYLLKYLNSDLAVNLMLSSRVTTAQPNISLTDVTGFPIPLPPLAEQHRIVAKVNTLMSLCDRLEAALTCADTTRTRLLETFLHAALEPAAE